VNVFCEPYGLTNYETFIMEIRTVSIETITVYVLQPAQYICTVHRKAAP